MAPQKINLLPKEFIKGKYNKNVSLIKNLSYFVVFIFFLGNSIGLGANFYFNNNLKNINNNQSRLKNSIQGLEETEQRLILAKDRIQKIQTILTARTSEEKLNKHKMLIENMPSNVLLEAQNIDASRSSLELSSSNSRDLVNFMASILARDDFDSIVLENMSFNPFQGYKVRLEIF